MVPGKATPRPPILWAYAYEIFPPQSEDRLEALRVVLEDGHSEAKLGAQTWEGRFVVEQRITHILVVSDRPDQDREVNRRVEAGLKELHAEFTLTIPLAVLDESAPAIPSGREEIVLPKHAG